MYPTLYCPRIPFQKREKNMYKLCLALVVALAIPSIADAGGGNAKAKGAIQFVNNTGLVALVTVDPSASLQAATTAQQFTARGGRILNPGETTTFNNLKAGSHRVGTALVPPGTTAVDAGAFTGSNVTVTAGNTRIINL
jgi:hypothetical protein